MKDEIVQFKSEEDNCIYFYDEKIQKYRKICDIDSPRDLPYSVRNQIKEAKEYAGKVQELPL